MFTLLSEVNSLLCDPASSYLMCEEREGLFCELHALSVPLPSTPLRPHFPLTVEYISLFKFKIKTCISHQYNNK